MARALLASIDGKIDSPGRSSIPVVDDGLLRGDGAFEVIKLYAGAPFRLESHLARLARSAAAIELGFDEVALREEVGAILQQDADPEGCMRVVLTRGGRRIILIEETQQWAPQVEVATIEAEPATVLTGVKSISYAGNMQLTRQAAGLGAEEAILINRDGHVLESPTASIFWADSTGRLHTPALSAGILDSITRAVLLEELPVTEGRYPAGDLRAASEAFLASTTREIQPVSSVDGAALPRVDGTAAAAARAVLRAAIEREARA